MTNWLSWRERWALIFPLRLRERLLQSAAQRSPAAFRREVKIAEGDARFATSIQPWQERDFAALDGAWLRLAGRRGAAGRQRAYIERPRGHAKTSDMALQIAWILQNAARPLRGLAAAADRDQAGLIWDAVQRIVRLNAWLCPDLAFRKHVVVNTATDSRLDVISSDVSSSWGALPDFVICDELCHWEKPDLWFSLLSSAAKRPDCLLAVLTNAGVGRGWQWEVREAARRSDGWYFSTLAGAQAPWISQQWLDEQKNLLPPPVYERLWQNIWQHSDGEFITLAEAEACRDERIEIQERGEPGRHYVAAVDYAEKHDRTVGVVVHRDGARIVVDRMDVITPRPDQPVRVRWVEDWIRRIASQFQRVTFVLDEYQLLGTIQALEHEFDVRRFEFAAGRGNHLLAVNLRKLILHRELAWYRGCGQAEGEMRDDLERELASLLLRQSASGRCRIDHRQDGLHHDDRAFALGAACLHVVKDSPGPEWLEVTEPAAGGAFAF